MYSNLLTEQAAAKALNVSVRTLARWRATGSVPLPYCRIGLRRVGYRAEDVDSYLASRRFEHRAAELASAA